MLHITSNDTTHRNVQDIGINNTVFNRKKNIGKNAQYLVLKTSINFS